MLLPWVGALLGAALIWGKSPVGWLTLRILWNVRHAGSTEMPIQLSVADAPGLRVWRIGPLREGFTGVSALLSPLWLGGEPALASRRSVYSPFSLEVASHPVDLLTLENAVVYWGEASADTLGLMRNNGLLITICGNTFNVLHPRPMIRAR